MAVAKYHALAHATLTSAQPSVTFSSIPSGYRDLRLIVNGQTTGALNNLQVQLNGDAGSNYLSVRMLGDGSSASAAAPSALTYMQFGDIGTLETLITGDIMDYSTTDRHKPALIRGNNASSGGVVTAYASRWASNTAVTAIKLTAGAGSFAIGCTFTLYGVK